MILLITPFLNRTFPANPTVELLIRNLNGVLYNACTKYGFHFVDNGVVSKCDLWKDGIHLLETGKAIIANNLISSINYFLENMIPPISSF